MYLLIFGLVVAIVAAYSSNSAFSSASASATTTKVDFSQFIRYLEDKQITEVTVSEGGLSYRALLSDGNYITTTAPNAYDMAIVSETYIIPQTAEGILTVKSSHSIWTGLISWVPYLLLFGFMIFFFMRMTGGGDGKNAMNFGKSHARMFKSDDKKVTFADVAGMDEEKAELEEIVDFLKNPKKYMELGARIPKGVLLVGPPGTGKTYVSKAVAGEAGVPFFSISGSDFVEMFVGVGASRVRDLFDTAKKNAPCLVFIDEIDAVGRRRGAGIGGGNDEREQTLNQLLVEMDGFGANEGIIILAATNRPDVLDPAILRPGRFDREITINTPDVKGREAIFKLYTKNKPIDEAVSIETLAKMTPGFTPADIENMMNEAALLTARRNGTIIHMDDLEEAITRVIAGPKKKSRVMSSKEKKLTAFHEAGHAVVTRAIPGSDPVHQVTIMPRGRAGGFTLSLPTEDKYYMTKGDMEDEIKILLGGRIAESIVMGDISTGASNDLERATKLAHDMVTKYGMSKTIGPINYSDNDEVFLGRDFTSKQNFSEELAAKIDREVRTIIDKAYEEAEKILNDHRAQLDAVAEALLDVETLDGEEFEAIYTGSKTLDQLKEENAAMSKVRSEKEKKEAEERAKREDEERKKREAEQPFTGDGKRIAVFDKGGNPLIMDLKTYVEEQKAKEGGEAEEPAKESVIQQPHEDEILQVFEKQNADNAEASDEPKTGAADASEDKNDNEQV